MAEHQGLVERITENGNAEVVIRPGKPGIVGAPEVSEKVCHSATDGSTVRTVAMNKAGARVGDLVVVTFDASVLRSNAISLLGIPIAGGLAGFLVGVASGGLGMHGVAVTMGVTVGVLLGIVIGGAIYKRSSKGHLPRVSRVVKSHTELMESLTKQGGIDKEANGCNVCSGCLKT